jgi:hypothetical protein
MIARTGVCERLALASEVCGRALEEGRFPQVVSRLGQYAEPAAAFDLLLQVTMSASGETLSALCPVYSMEREETDVERALLLLASRHAADQVNALPVSDRVKQLFAEEFEFFAEPTPAWLPHFRFDDIRFREMARIATLRRFPAGQFHWEMAALPRSWLIRTPQAFALLHHALLKMRGFSPLFEFHLNERRKNRILLLEKPGAISYYRAAKSMEKQPAVKGAMFASWLFGKSTAEVSPHLAWLRTVPQSGGAFAVDLGPAAEDAGFLIGGGERRKKYQDGSFRPRVGCILWARKDLIAWANQHPEFDV